MCDDDYKNSLKDKNLTEIEMELYFLNLFKPPIETTYNYYVLAALIFPILYIYSLVFDWMWIKELSVLKIASMIAFTLIMSALALGEYANLKEMRTKIKIVKNRIIHLKAISY